MSAVLLERPSVDRTEGQDVAAAGDALRAMPAGQAAALLLASRPGMSYREVAARLDEDPRTVLRWLSGGLRSIHEVAARQRADAAMPA